MPSGKIPGDLSIMDVGSGDGRYALFFAKQGFKDVTAVEITSAGANRIRRNGSGYRNLQVLQENALNLKRIRGYDKQYDVVLSSGMLEEMSSQEDQRQAVTNLQALVKPGGRIVLRYCLYISDKIPPARVKAGFVQSLFPSEQWQIIDNRTDPEPFENKKASVYKGISRIQRETIVAQKK